MLSTEHGLHPSLMTDILFPQTNHYNLRTDSVTDLARKRSATRGSGTIRFTGPQLWCTPPLSIRQSTNLFEFKAKIKIWGANKCRCQCRLCRNFVLFLRAFLGFLWLLLCLFFYCILVGFLAISCSLDLYMHSSIILLCNLCKKNEKALNLFTAALLKVTKLRRGNDITMYNREEKVIVNFSQLIFKREFLWI